MYTLSVCRLTHIYPKMLEMILDPGMIYVNQK